MMLVKNYGAKVEYVLQNMDDENQKQSSGTLNPSPSGESNQKHPIMLCLEGDEDHDLPADAQGHYGDMTIFT